MKYDRATHNTLVEKHACWFVHYETAKDVKVVIVAFTTLFTEVVIEIY